MIEPEKDEQDRTDEERRLEEAKKATDIMATSLIALGSSAAMFWVIGLACNRWFIRPPIVLVLLAAGVACLPLIALAAQRTFPEAAWAERRFKDSARLSLVAVLCSVLGLQAAHVARHGWAHWNCLAVGEEWQERHPEIHGTVVGFSCGAEACARVDALRHSAARMVVEFDVLPWYEPRYQPDECRRAILNLKPGVWLPLVGSRVSAAPDVCHSFQRQGAAAWHPIR
jgi:hypothetical protein